MKTFVLIPGAWMGAWAWEQVSPFLAERGHRVLPVTLTGLDTPDADVSGIGLETHVDDVLSLLDGEDLRDVVLVGHNVGGIVAGIVADRAPGRVSHLVFVEAVVPRDGRSALDALPRDMHAAENRLIAENGGRWPIPDAAIVEDGQDLTAEQAKWLVDHFVGHPGRPLCEPVILKRPVSQRQGTYIVCEKEHFDGRLAADVTALRHEPAWTFRSLDTGLWPMVSAPEALAGHLLDTASSGRDRQAGPGPCPGPDAWARAE